MKTHCIQIFALLASMLLSQAVPAEMSHHGMIMNDKGMIMNDNPDKLPQDCRKLAATVDITIRAGHKHAQKFPGKMFAFDQQEWNVEPCTKINVTFVNEDDIRHQLMIHGLPGYLYPDGMFHLELYGPGELKASLIVPGQKKTYLVHCELPQHMEKGMKAQLKAGGGDVDLPSIPGISKAINADTYPVEWNGPTLALLLFSALVGLILPYWLLKFR